MIAFGSFSGIITRIDDFRTTTGESIGCYKLITVENKVTGIVNFVISPSTYFVDHTMMEVGYAVIGFYEANVPVPLIYPPQYQAIVMSRLIRGQNVKVDYFNNQLVSSDGTLKLNVSTFTEVILENGQAFTANPANHVLIVVYGPTTRSIPAQTMPYKIIVKCSEAR